MPRRAAPCAGSGCTAAEVGDVVYTSLLQHLGCTAYAHEAAQVWGDDVASVRLAFLTDFAHPLDVWRTWVPGLAEATGRSRARVLATTHGPEGRGRRTRGDLRRRP